MCVRPCHEPPYIGIRGRGKGEISQTTPCLGGARKAFQGTHHIWAYVNGESEEYQKPVPRGWGNFNWTRTSELMQIYRNLLPPRHRERENLTIRLVALFNIIARSFRCLYRHTSFRRFLLSTWRPDKAASFPPISNLFYVRNSCLIRNCLSTFM